MQHRTHPTFIHTPPLTVHTTPSHQPPAGSYAFVGKINGKAHFFTTDNDAIAVYVLEGDDAKGYTIQPAGRLALPSFANPNGEDHLVRACLDCLVCLHVCVVRVSERAFKIL